MIGLIVKDMLLMRLGFVWIFVFVIVFCAIINSPEVACMLSPVVVSSMASSSMAMDDGCGWNAFAISSGIPRRELVGSKFTAGAIFVLVGTVLGFAIALASTIIIGELSIVDIISASVMGFAIGMIVMSVSVTVNYVIGNSQRSTYISILITIVCIISLSAASEIVTSALDEKIPFIVVLVLVMLGAVTCLERLSVNRFEKANL